ncbi:tRNA preQ1(34) S-adenosylmethionine ribosyltransferase-isomerase QueA [candidate division WWE3 bacterium]|uniref:S-adenosylmethionine:tRNA ribosyltransferase-isomerase n=1 Tax=candidate division WWE3 bacterium TaxID=2053526 RepID=A0A955LX64_UNCKA|nr:tRNA preQ1(34) S-adenosylmethionine ribosyltransferase-isomerase QueA [candidate division WWE3 bacterium]
MLDISDYSYHLPDSYIAQKPSDPRDHSRLMILNRQDGSIEHKRFYELKNQLTNNDVLVLNQSKVFPARLFGNKPTGGAVELLLTRHIKDTTWETISKPGLNIGQQILFSNGPKAAVVEKDAEHGFLHVTFETDSDSFRTFLYEAGKTPLPPYIASTETEEELRNEYQTVYATQEGSSAAPTAGLHFTNDLIKELQNKGVSIEYVTLHVGPGTFQNLREEQIRDNKLHSEWYEIDPETAISLNKAKENGKRIIAVGTTTTRTLESAASHKNILDTDLLTTDSLSTDLFIHPPYQFKFVDSLVTNFHLPQSSLLMLVSAFTTQPNAPDAFSTFAESLIGSAYQTAIENDYRFFSFGDAMWIR